MKWEKLEAYRKDNKGGTLAELLIALAISTIILSGIAYMLFTSLKVSGKNNAGAEVQSEVQTSMNLIMDQIMEAEGICMRISPSGGNSECVLFGKVLIKETGGSYSFYYRGNAIVADIGMGGTGELYLVEFPNELYVADAEGFCTLGNAVSEIESVQEGLDNVKKYIMDMAAEDRIRWLMGKDIVSCRIMPESEYGEKTVKENGVETICSLFSEPFAVTVSLEAESDYGEGKIERTLNDRAAVRNRMEKIYLTKPGEAENNVEIYERER